MSNRSFTLAGDAWEKSAVIFAGILACTGLLNASIAALIVCRLPPSSSPSWTGLILRAWLYVCGAAAAGTGGTWFYWKRSAVSSRLNFPVPFSSFCLACAVGWAWVPAVVLLVEERSPLAAAIAAVGGSILAVALRKTFPILKDQARMYWSEGASDPELFAGFQETPALQPQGYAVAISIYAAALAVYDHSIYTASALLAIGAFIFAWESVAPIDSPSRQPERRRVVSRTACNTVAAVLVTIWAMLDGISHPGRPAADVAFARANEGENSVKAPNSVTHGGVPGGFESIILWPYPQKKKIIPPIPVQTNLLAPGTTRPLVIRFDGAYWYFQPPESRPGPTAHQAHGTPLSAHVQANNSFPLIMDAHQNLGTAIPLARCREMTVDVENRDDRLGAIAVAMLLSDSTEPGKPAVYLGQQVLQTSLPDRARATGTSAFETLRFAIPTRGRIRKFDEITVMLLPDSGYTVIGPKIAIQQFQLFPR